MSSHRQSHWRFPLQIRYISEEIEKHFLTICLEHMYIILSINGQSQETQCIVKGIFLPHCSPVSQPQAFCIVYKAPFLLKNGNRCFHFLKHYMLTTGFLADRTVFLHASHPVWLLNWTFQSSTMTTKNLKACAKFQKQENYNLDAKE